MGELDVRADWSSFDMRAGVRFCRRVFGVCADAQFCGSGAFAFTGRQPNCEALAEWQPSCKAPVERRLSCAPLVALVLLLAALAAVASMLAPQQALAKSYEMPKVSISAEAQTDGSLHVVEKRAFAFNGDFTAVWWTFDGLPSNADLVINGVRLDSAAGSGEAGSSDGAGGSGDSSGVFGEIANFFGASDSEAASDGADSDSGIDLQSVPFRESWRDAGGPGTNAYSFDSAQNTVYAFFDASDETIVITLDYTVVNGVQAYEDVAEVYWKYVGDQWEEASSDVTMTLTLPVAAGSSVVPGNNVRAWGHGPLDGIVEVNGNGTITYTVPKVRAGQYAEARVLFPVSWLTDLRGQAAKAHQDTARLDTVLSEEAAWADQANRQRMLSLAVVIACGVICALSLVWALARYLKYGKEHKPDFTDQYWRSVPDRSLHPAVIARLWRWGRENPDDFVTTLIHLAQIGIIRIDRSCRADVQTARAAQNGQAAQTAQSVHAAPERQGAVGAVDDYLITRLPTVAGDALDPVDRAALDFLFGKMAGGRPSLWFSDIVRYGENHSEEFVAGMEAWQSVLSAETDKRDFFEPKSNRLQVYMIAVAVVLLVIGVLVSLWQDNFIPLVFAVPTSIVLAVLANYMPRRSVYGNNVVARCKALRNWLRDCSSLGEQLPSDVQTWGELMVYAYVFGIADKVMKELHLGSPQLFWEGNSSCDGSYVPWWLWYESGRSSTGAVLSPVATAFQTAMSNTESVAQAAISAASGGSSSAGGGGGGFSGGGGGGFGGGGGAR